MSQPRKAISDRAEELLIDQVTEGLNASQQYELDRLLDDRAEAMENDFMQTTALVQLGMLSRDGRSSDRMPDELRRKIAAGSPASAPTRIDQLSQARVSKPDTKPVFSMPAWSYSGWALAAAFALLFFVVRGEPPLTSVDPMSLAQQRAALIENATDTIAVPWAQPEQAAYRDVTGDVVWSDAQQQGFMRLAGLPVNDPSVAQYQLWIVDPERGEQPVDGGVFDVPADAGEIIVPIDSKLGVDAPTVFAITLEQPGGVVVSKGPLLIVAPVSS